MKRVPVELPSQLDEGRCWIWLPLSAVAAMWCILTWPLSAAVWLGVWIVNAFVRLALAMLGLLVGGFLLYGVGYVIFYPLIVR